MIFSIPDSPLELCCVNASAKNKQGRDIGGKHPDLRSRRHLARQATGGLSGVQDWQKFGDGPGRPRIALKSGHFPFLFNTPGASRTPRPRCRPMGMDGPKPAQAQKIVPP
jgi:hypothetical protein